MKIDIKHFALAAAGATMLLTSCIGDLDTLPLNPSDSTSETVYGKDENGYLAGLTKLYFNFVSNDTTDLQVSDGGASELIRAFWTIQEVTADACKCAWENDAWVRAMNTDTWSDADNDATYAVYVRTLQGIAYVNEYLRQTASDKLSDRGVSSELAARIQSFRAEARFLRAYFYWIALDVFGDVPFTTETSPFGGGVNPKQASRKDVFDYCISELTDLASDESAMPAARSNYPRADKGAVNGLLARMYLNAEVYAGTPMWTEAKSACEAIFGMGYSLCPEYSDLFRGDNGENADALKEIIFGVAYDAEQTQSYGGTSYLTLAAIAATDVTAEQKINGVNNGWAGIRVPYEYVQKYFNARNADYTTGEYTVNDKRGGMFYIKGRQESMNDALYVFLNGWTCLKFNNIPPQHDQRRIPCHGCIEGIQRHRLPDDPPGRDLPDLRRGLHEPGTGQHRAAEAQGADRPRRGIGPLVGHGRLPARGACPRADVGGAPPHRPDPLRQVHHPVVPLDIQGRHLHRTGVR